MNQIQLTTGRATDSKKSNCIYPSQKGTKASPPCRSSKRKRVPLHLYRLSSDLSYLSSITPATTPNTDHLSKSLVYKQKMGRAQVVEEGQTPSSRVEQPPTPSSRKLRRNSWSFSSLGQDLTDDLIVLKHLWFSNLAPGSKKSTATHAQRLESFYGPQAAACACGFGWGWRAWEFR